VLNQSSLDGRLEISKNWLFSEPSETITLQIKSLRSGDALSEEQLKEEFNQTKRQLGIEKVYLYRKKQNGQDYTVILYGAFKQRDEALAALKKLPASIKNNKPYLRTLAGINKEIEEGQ
jgi:MSHA biogenesis protein MshM